MNVRPVVLLAAFAASVWVYGEIRASRARAEERAAAREQQLRDSTAAADSLERLRRHADSLARVTDAVTRAQLARLHVREARATERADSLLALVPDTLLAKQIRAQYDTAITALHEALHTSENRAALFYQRWVAADSAAQRWEGLAGSWRRQAEYWRARQPSGFEKVLTVASCATLGFAASERNALVAGGAGLVCLITGT